MLGRRRVCPLSFELRLWSIGFLTSAWGDAGGVNIVLSMTLAFLPVDDCVDGEDDDDDDDDDNGR